MNEIWMFNGRPEPNEDRRALTLKFALGDALHSAMGRGLFDPRFGGAHASPFSSVPTSWCNGGRSLWIVFQTISRSTLK